MGRLKIALAVAALLAGPAAQAHAQVQLSMNDGRVTLVAKDATVRQILAEWARVGQARIVNGERVMGGPVSIELIDVPEKQALDIVLRSISGYMAAPRPEPIPNASRFDRILVLPAPAQARTVSSSPAPPPPVPQPRVQQPFGSDQDLDSPPGAVPGVAPGRDTFSVGQRPPVVPATPMPAPATSAPVLPPPTPAPVPTPPATTPSVPTGTRAPGIIVQPPPPQAPVSPVPPPSR